MITLCISLEIIIHLNASNSTSLLFIGTSCNGLEGKISKIINNLIDSGCYNSHILVNYFFFNFSKDGLCVMLKYPDNMHVTDRGNWFPIQCSSLNNVVCSKPVGQYMYFIMNLFINNTIIYLFKMQFSLQYITNVQQTNFNVHLL